MNIAIQQLITPLLALWLPFMRILAFFLFCPLLDNRALPRKARIVLALLLSILIAPMLPHQPAPDELLSVRTLLLTGEQLLWGLVFGQILWWVFWTLQTAGAILSMNMGLGMAVMNDPSSGSSTMVISQIIFIWTGLLFFSFDGHLLLVTILYKSFIYWPPGQAISQSSLRTAATGVGFIISGALLLALPTVLIMMLVQCVFGLLNRVSPTLNLFSLGFPISMLFGLFCFMVLSGHLGERYLQLTNQVLGVLERLRMA
ncbi:flagellar biosynthetic protein FliR [Izhakiella australiensis]|uniref:Flagellar biosynthetic protein FliR n=1 Tax=Izhakiella australiensis TaxID=1926881 RepID=A0A1S8YI35_9GAMM|nr:flagellar biosynthetic protein FliR [Izhakiella australiensis]OON38739.1 flagellar biosynthetic protein FliR [Izhakiella australiensis]